MSFQMIRSTERFTADVTHVWSFVSMGNEVSSQCTRLAECSATNFTHERSGVDMNSYVRYQLTGVCKCHVADVTYIWPLSSVCSAVARQTCHVRERFPAKVAQALFRDFVVKFSAVVGVQSFVLGKAAAKPKPFLTNVAWKWFHSSVGSNVAD